MNQHIEARPFESIHAKELKSLIAGGAGRQLAALIDLPSGRTLTVDAGAADDSSSGVGSGLAALARVLLARGDAADNSVARNLCANWGGITSIAVLMPECDLLMSRVASSYEVLCLAVRRAHAAVGGFDSIVHLRALQAGLHSSGKVESALAEVAAETERNFSLWRRILSALGVEAANRAAAPGDRDAGASQRDGRSARLRPLCESDDHILAADLLGPRNGKPAESFRRTGTTIPLIPLDQLSKVVQGLLAGESSLLSLATIYGFEEPSLGKVQIQVGQRDVHLLRTPYFPALRIPFSDAQALVWVKPPRANPSLDWASLDRVGLNLLRLRVGAMLSSGLKTQMSPFPETQAEFQAILERIAALPDDDLLGRLEIGGFAAHTVTLDDTEQRCAECIYYLPHRKWCDLPELPIPVEPQWWCRLWKL